MARKPVVGSTTATVRMHGTGGLNIDGARVPMSGEDREKFLRGAEAWQDMARRHGQTLGNGDLRKPTTIYGDYGVQASGPHDAGRWPANVLLGHGVTEDGFDACADGCLPGCPVATLDEQTGITTSRTGAPRSGPAGNGWGMTATGSEYNDQGGASRFLPRFRWQAKAPTAERPVVDGASHPTVKPLELMRWLMRLITPPGGTVLEPFPGSGTTVEAAIIEGFPVIASEKFERYLPHIRQRIDRQRHPVDYLRTMSRERPEQHDLGLLALLEDGA